MSWVKMKCKSQGERQFEFTHAQRILAVQEKYLVPAESRWEIAEKNPGMPANQESSKKRKVKQKEE
jgi:hypothetical protein